MQSSNNKDAIPLINTLPYLSYGLCIYGSTTKSNLDRILIQQKKALRIIMNMKRMDSVKLVFSQLGILTVYGQYVLDVIMHVRNYPVEELRNETHGYNTRFGRITERHRLEFFKKKTHYMGRKYFTMLPTELQSIEDVKKFRIRVKEYLVLMSLYSLQEYTEK